MSSPPTPIAQSNQERCDYAHISTECPAVVALGKRVDEVAKGFPFEDYKGHADYHMELIEIAKARREFWNKLTFELAKFGLIGFVGWAIIQLWTAFLRGKVGM